MGNNDEMNLRASKAAQGAWPLPNEEIDSWRSLNLSGENYANADGKLRQDVILSLSPGDRLTLAPEPDNPYDEGAIAVFSEAGQVGYIPGQHCAWIGEKMARGYGVNCRIERFKGGEDGLSDVQIVAGIRISLLIDE